NAGNGTDSMTISENISVAGVITVTGYRYGATTYGTLAALNTALSSVGIAQGGSITLKIVYNVASGQGGVSTVYTLTANSRRTPATARASRWRPRRRRRSPSCTTWRTWPAARRIRCTCAAGRWGSPRRSTTASWT